MKKLALILAGVSLLALTGLACEPAAKPAPADGEATTAPAARRAISPEAALSLAELKPPLQRPSNPPDADKLPERAETIVAEAETLLGKRDFVKAIQLLERARGFAPKSPRVLRDLGLAYASLGDRGKARANLREALKLAPDQIRLNLILSQYAVLDRHSDQAIVHLRTGLLCSGAKDENPDTAETLWRLGRLLEARGYLTAALECYSRLSGLLADHGRGYRARAVLRPLVDRPEAVLVAQGRAMVRLEKFAEAARILERAYRRDKTHRQAGALAVRALLAGREYDRAQAIVMEMLVSPSQRSRGIALAVELCKARKDPAAPGQLLRLYTDSGGEDRAFVMAMAEAAADLGARDEAARILTRHLGTSPEDDRGALRLARLYARTGDLRAAAKQLAGLLAEEGGQLRQVAPEITYLLRQGAKKPLAEELASAAEKAKGRLAPASLCVAGLIADGAGEDELAVSLLRRAIQTDPRFWAAYEALEQVYLAAGRFDDMDDLGKRVDKVAPKGYFRDYFLGKIAFDRGRIDRAVAELGKARQRRASHVPTLHLLGRAHLRRRQFDDAEKYLAAARALAPDDEAVLRDLVEMHLARRQLVKAAHAVALFRLRNPKRVAGRVLAARVRYESNRLERARAELEKLLAEAPDDVEVRLLELRMALPRALKGEPIDAAEADAAFAMIDRILRLDPANLQAQVLRALLLANQKKYSQAADAWKSVVERKGHDLAAVEGYLSALARAGRPKQVSAAVQRIVKEQPAGIAMRLMLLGKLLEVKDYAQAEGIVGKWLAEYARQERPDRAELTMFRLRALKVYEKAARFDKAQELLDAWIAAGTDEDFLTVLRREKLRMYGLAKQFDEAVSYAEKWFRNEPGSMEPRSGLFTVLLEGKAYAKLHAVLDEWIRAEKDPEALERLHIRKLIAFSMAKNTEELLRFGRKWIAKDPTSETPNMAIIGELIDLKKYDDALKVAEDWLARVEQMPASMPASMPTSAPAGKGRAKLVESAKSAVVSVLLTAERNREALQRARAFAKAEPKNARILQLVFIALRALDREKEAMALLQEIYELNPDDSIVNNDLGYYWADMGINLDKAEAMIRKALASEPRNVAVLDSFAWVLYKQGRFAEAKNVFERCLKLGTEPYHPVILDHVGDTCWRLGLKDEAVGHWTKAVEAAKKLETKESDDRKVLAETPLKLSAAREGKAPKVAPLGKGVAEPDGK